MATSFEVNIADLEFILKQIKIAEDTSVGYTTAPKTILQSIMGAYGVTAVNAAQMPAGLRTVDGTGNGLLPGANEFGAADNLFPRLTDPVFLVDADGDTIDFDGAGPGPAVTASAGSSASNYGYTGSGSHSVVDADPRIISNLIVDMTAANPAAVEAALAHHGITGDDAVAAAAAIAAAQALVVSTSAAAAATNAGALEATYNAAVAADLYTIPANLADAADDEAAAVGAASGLLGTALFNAYTIRACRQLMRVR